MTRRQSRLPFVPHSLRARLTAWTGLVVGIVLIAFTLAVYGLLARSLAAEVDNSLLERSQEVNRALQRVAPERLQRQVVVPRANRLGSFGIFVQISSLSAAPIGSSDNLGTTTLPLTPADLAAVQAGHGQYSVTHLQGETVRVYTAPLIVHTTPAGIIQVARSLEPTAHSLRQLRWLAGGGLLLALAGSAFGVWLTTRQALRPLTNVIDTTAMIAASGDLTHRVSPTLPDEVGLLAATVNRMLERLAAADAERRSAADHVAQMLEAQRRFVADASHELRTPLTTIRGNASLLRQFPQVTATDRAAALEQIGQEAERMSRLVQGLLTLARADAGQLLTHTPVALGRLVNDVLNQTRLLAHGQHIAAVLQPAIVNGDPDALRQLVLILIDNALHYTPTTGRIDVALQTIGTNAELTVKDTGVGIRAADLPHIFERFYRADRGRKAGGTGLGLAIAHWIVSEHGGQITVTSEPSSGSTFTVRLPLLTPPQL